MILSRFCFIQSDKEIMITFNKYSTVEEVEGQIFGLQVIFDSSVIFVIYHFGSFFCLMIRVHLKQCKVLQRCRYGLVIKIFQ